MELLTYEQALDFIHGIERFGSKPGLRRVRMLLERMGNPQDGLRFIHVAGTDGKGSTCAMLSHILAGAGYRTGLYISPYVIDFRERIQVDNEMIPPGDLAMSASVVKEHWDALDAAGETPTEFEVVVAAAFDHFLRRRCDVVVLEVGMGGRFDATNVIGAPLCSVITHLSMDHMQYLGDTLAKIAFEKCGIIKEGGRTVCYPRQEPEALAVVMEQCGLKGNELYMGTNAEILRADISGSDFRYGGREYRVPLAGEHQVWNAVTAIEAVKAAALSDLAVTEEQVRAGLAATRFPSRVEVLCREPLVLLDGGHNPAEAAALSRALSLLPGGKIHAVMGMMADKDVEGCLRHVLPRCASLTAVTPEYPRAMRAEELARLAGRYCAEVSAAAGAREGARAALRRCGREDALLVCGSLFLAAELRPFLTELVEKGNTFYK